MTTWQRTSSPINDINTFVDGTLWNGDHPWDAFLGALTQGPVHFPDGHLATLVDEHSDPYGDPGESWFVFKIDAGWNTPEKFYQRTTAVSSFGSTEHGETIEVASTPVQTTEWNPI